MKQKPKEYEIETISDISKLVTKDNFEAFFTDMVHVYSKFVNIKEKVPEMDMPSFKWIDDGKHDLSATLNGKQIPDVDIESVDNWINVNDRLPDEYCQVLVWCPRSFPKNCRFLSANYYPDNKGFYGDSSEEVHEDVTHWMPEPIKPTS
mgnify:CR=1 FL=1